MKKGHVFNSPRSLPASERPAALYKYRSPNRVDLLEDLVIAFAPPLLFNDIFECFFGAGPGLNYGQLKRVYEVETKTLSERNLHLGKKKVAQIVAERKEGFKQWVRRERSSHARQARCELVRDVTSSIAYILSFADKPDNVLMWAHYTQNHAGFVVEFDGRHSFFDGLHRVHYSKERPRYEPDESGMTGPEIFMTKSSEWSYEGEYRLVRLESENELSFSTGQLGFVTADMSRFDPGKLTPVFCELPPEAIRSIIFGHRMSSENRQTVLTLLKSPSLAHVKVAEAKPHPRLFRMEIRRI